MNTTLHLRGVSRPKEIRRFATSRLQRALGRFSHIVHSVSIDIHDENGPKGGEDMRGKLILITRDGETLVLVDRSTSAAATISALTRRARQRLGRHLERLHGRRRGIARAS